MGLGKTIQTLALLQREWERASASSGRPCSSAPRPSSATGRRRPPVHARPARDGPPRRATRARGAPSRSRPARHALVLSSYSLLHRDLELLEAGDLGRRVLDEAQNIKNPQTKQAQAARALPGEYRIALTGTPVENHVGDLWSIMEFLNPGLLGTHNDFKRDFFVPIQAEQRSRRRRRLKRLTAPFILRRLKTDQSIIADLPDKLEMKVYLQPDQGAGLALRRRRQGR